MIVHAHFVMRFNRLIMVRPGQRNIPETFSPPNDDIIVHRSSVTRQLYVTRACNLFVSIRHADDLGLRDETSPNQQSVAFQLFIVCVCFWFASCFILLFYYISDGR